mgnify:CR=1 FL=1
MGLPLMVDFVVEEQNYRNPLPQLRCLYLHHLNIVAPKVSRKIIALFSTPQRVFTSIIALFSTPQRVLASTSVENIVALVAID